MWKKNKIKKSVKINTLIGHNTRLNGNITFTGGLHIDGEVIGNVCADDNSTDAVLIVSEHGKIEGEVNVPCVVLNGTVTGNVTSSDQIELASNAKVNGDVYYHLIEMAMGAEVNGSLVHETKRQNHLQKTENE